MIFCMDLYFHSICLNIWRFGLTRPRLAFMTFFTKHSQYFDLLLRVCKYDILKKKKFSKEILHMQEFCTCQSMCRGFDKYMVQ